VTVAGLAAYALATWLSTDGVTITINSLKVIDANNAQINYSVSSMGFELSVGDSLDFSGQASGITTPPLGSGVSVNTIIDSTNCIISVNITAISGVPVSSTSISAPTGTTYWGTAIVHSSVENQFLGAVSNTAAAVANAAAAVVSAVVSASIPVINELTSGSNSLFCKTIPFVCNAGNTLKWVVGVICILLSLAIAAYFILK
jgi:hypothetical protein